MNIENNGKFAIQTVLMIVDTNIEHKGKFSIQTVLMIVDMNIEQFNNTHSVAYSRKSLIGE